MVQTEVKTPSSFHPVWETSVGQNEDSWTTLQTLLQVAKSFNYVKREHDDFPHYVVITAFLTTPSDDDVVSVLNSEADVEDDDCWPEATIQVLETLFDTSFLNDDNNEIDSESDDGDSDADTQSTRSGIFFRIDDEIFSKDDTEEESTVVVPPNSLCESFDDDNIFDGPSITFTISTDSSASTETPS